MTTSMSYTAVNEGIPYTMPYRERRRNYINTLKWDDETEYLAVYVNDVEVQFDFHSDGSLIYLTDQPKINDKIDIKVEPITFLETTETNDTTEHRTQD